MKRGILITVITTIALVVVHSIVKHFNFDIEYIILAYLISWRLDDTV